MLQALSSAVLLSRGGTWRPNPWEPPYLMPDPGKEWPTKAIATCTFTDSSGATILELDGVVKPDGIYFDGDPEDMDQVPGGAGYTITLETLGDGGVFPIRYGTVIRKEVFYTQPAAKAIAAPRMFSDSFQRTALGRKWVGITGRTVIRNNSALSLPNGVTPETAFFTKSAIRWWQEFSSDSCEIGVTLLNTEPLLSGRTAVVFCADLGFTTGIGMRFETSLFGNRLHLGMVNGPNSLVDETASIVSPVANGDYYRVRYTDSTKVAAVYKGTSLDPLLTWTDTTGAVAHGRGYRHYGLAFETALLGRGIQVTSISAMDIAA